VFELLASTDVSILKLSGQQEVNQCNDERDNCDGQRCTRVCSDRVGYSKCQPMQCIPPKMTPNRAKTAIHDQQSLFVTGA